jgi:site-specific recombinase XerD
MRRWDTLVDRYMEEYSARGLSAETVHGVRCELDKWGSWMKRRRPRPRLEKIDSDLLLRYLQDRTAFRSKATVSSVVSKMRCMGKFLVREGYWSQNPFRWIKGPKRDPRARLPRRISKEAMQQLWQSAAMNRQGYSRSLWIAVLGVLYGAGLRRGELERLNVSHWNRDDGVLEVDGRKTGWERRVVLPDVSRACLESYLVQRHNHLERLGRLEEDALLVNQNGFRLKGLQISRGLSRIIRRAGLEKITVRQFRHTCASDLLEAGLHVAQVQEILGHRAISTTVRYLHVSDPQKTTAVRLHPINDILKRREIDHES